MERAKLIEQRDRLAEAISSHIPDPGTSIVLSADELRHFDFTCKAHFAVCNQLASTATEPMDLVGDEALSMAKRLLDDYVVDHPKLAEWLRPAIGAIRACLAEGGAS